MSRISTSSSESTLGRTGLPRRKRQQLWHAAALAFILAPLLSAATCSPTPRPCREGAGPLECEPPLLPVCLDRCVEPAALGEPCSDDPCSTDAPPCGDSFICASEPGSSMRICTELQHFEGLFCRTSDQSARPCPTGLVCQGFEDAVVAACSGIPRSSIVPADIDGQCVMPVREGGQCDATWGTPGCRVCESGTECLGDPRAPATRRCFRPCDSSDDCPCRSEDPEVLDSCVAGPERSSLGNICTGCVANGELCSEWGCCDDLDVCPGSSPTRRCCRPFGRACGPGAGCCPGATCATDGMCRRCGRAGARHDPILGCCAGTHDRGDGLCVVDCTEGTPCTPTRCPTLNGRTVCTDTTATCEPVGLMSEQCNGKDDDCNGRIDDRLASRPCYDGKVERCQQTFEGVITCQAGREVCEARSWCRYEYLTRTFTHGSGASGSACHWGRWECDTDSDPRGIGGDAACPPGTACVSFACRGDRLLCQIHNVTAPCPFGEDAWTALPCRGVLCWAPEDFEASDFPQGSHACQ
jgi:hypothetical protein